MDPLLEYYRVLCKPFSLKGRDIPVLECRHPAQQFYHQPTLYSDVRDGARTRIDFFISKDPIKPYYHKAEYDFFNKKKGNAADWDYFLTDEEFLAQERQVKE